MGCASDAHRQMHPHGQPYWEHLDLPGTPGYTWVHLGTPGYTWVHLGIPGYTREHLDLPGPPDVQTDGHQKTACQRSISIYPQCGISTSLTHCSVPSKSE